MNFRQRWDQIIYTSLEGDLRDVVYYTILDENKLTYLKKFCKEYNGKFEADTLRETSKSLEGYIKPINPEIINVLLDVDGMFINIPKLTGFEFIVKRGHPKILSDVKLSRYMDIQKLYDYFRVSNTEALLTLVKTFPASLEERLVRDIYTMSLIPDIYIYLKEKGLLKTIVVKDLLKRLERTFQSMPISMMYFDDVAPEDAEDLEWYSYADRTSKDYQTRLSIFKHIFSTCTPELVDYLKEHQLYDFLYVRVLNDLSR
jgi:hypothetical protein